MLLWQLCHSVWTSTEQTQTWKYAALRLCNKEKYFCTSSWEHCEISNNALPATEIAFISIKLAALATYTMGSYRQGPVTCTKPFSLREAVPNPALGLRYPVTPAATGGARRTNRQRRGWATARQTSHRIWRWCRTDRPPWSSTAPCIPSATWGGASHTYYCVCPSYSSPFWSLRGLTVTAKQVTDITLK
jgi:hypothetical protein